MKQLRNSERLALIAIVPAVLVFGERAVLWAQATIKTWQAGETLTAEDLNQNFEELRDALATTQLGRSPETAAASCKALYDAGQRVSGPAYVRVAASANPNLAETPLLVYCEQVAHGGGWALVYNSVMGTDSRFFWNIPYAERLTRRGRVSLDTNFYDGALYQTASAEYFDVVEDLQGQEFTMFVASASGINNSTMRFSEPQLVEGVSSLYNNHFAEGWSAPDFDGDPHETYNCAAEYSQVTQHYGACWGYSLGSDASNDDGNEDANVGPHVRAATVTGIHDDGSTYTRVRRISRFVRW